MNFVMLERFTFDDPKERLDQMRLVCMDSFRRFLLGDWEFLLVGTLRDAPPRSWHRAIEHQFRRVAELWKHGHNVLIVSPDVICVKPTPMFSRLGMQLFWYTDPEPLLNGGVVYVGRSTEADVMHYMLSELARVDDGDDWGATQRILNETFYRQRFQPVLENAMNWSPQVRNEIPKSAAHIIHHHYTRDRVGTLAKMQADWRSVQEAI